MQDCFESKTFLFAFSTQSFSSSSNTSVGLSDWSSQFTRKGQKLWPKTCPQNQLCIQKLTDRRRSRSILIFRHKSIQFPKLNSRQEPIYLTSPKNQWTSSGKLVIISPVLCAQNHTKSTFCLRKGWMFFTNRSKSFLNLSVVQKVWWKNILRSLEIYRPSFSFSCVIKSIVIFCASCNRVRVAGKASVQFVTIKNYFQAQ